MPDEPKNRNGGLLTGVRRFCANIVHPNIIYLSFYQKYTFTLQFFRYLCNMITSKPDNMLD